MWQSVVPQLRDIVECYTVYDRERLSFLAGGVRVLIGGSYPESNVVQILLEMLELLLFPRESKQEQEQEDKEHEEKSDTISSEEKEVEEEEHEWHGGSGHWWGVSLEVAEELLQAMTKMVQNGSSANSADRSANDNGGTAVSSAFGAETMESHSQSLEVDHVVSPQQSRQIVVLLHRVCTLGLEGAFYLHHFHVHAAEVSAADFAEEVERKGVEGTTEPADDAGTSSTPTDAGFTDAGVVAPLLLLELREQLVGLVRLALRLASTCRSFPRAFNIDLLLGALHSGQSDLIIAVREVLENVLAVSEQAVLLPLLPLLGSGMQPNQSPSNSNTTDGTEAGNTRELYEGAGVLSGVASEASRILGLEQDDSGGSGQAQSQLQSQGSSTPIEPLSPYSVARPTLAPIQEQWEQQQQQIPAWCAYLEYLLKCWLLSPEPARVWSV